jgi:hypothetical protein
MIDFDFGDWIWNSTPALPEEVDIRQRRGISNKFDYDSILPLQSLGTACERSSHISDACIMKSCSSAAALHSLATLAPFVIEKMKF